MREKSTAITIRQTGDLIQERRITLRELSDETGVEITSIEEMVQFGIIEPVTRTAETWVFPDWAASRVSKAIRLKQTFELNANGLGLVLELLDRIEELEDEVRGKSG